MYICARVFSSSVKMDSFHNLLCEGLGVFAVHVGFYLIICISDYTVYIDPPLWCVCVCVCVCVCGSTYVLYTVYIYIYIHTHIHSMYLAVYSVLTCAKFDLHWTFRNQTLV